MALTNSIILSVVLLLISFIHEATSCAMHTNYQRHPRLGRRQKESGGSLRKQLDWNYERTQDWHTIQEAYATCQSGTNQSPINLRTPSGLSQSHFPDFAGYDTSSLETKPSGNFFNWGFGPAYTLHRSSEESLEGLPTFTFDNETVALIGFHVHAPSEHSVDDVRSKAELHFVHSSTETKTERAVIGVRLEASHAKTSPFIDTVLPHLKATTDFTQTEGVELDFTQLIREVDNVSDFWTYRGSLTTPPCTEGLRWFVPKMPLFVSVEQLQAVVGKARFSHRETQEVWLHDVNV